MPDNYNTNLLAEEPDANVNELPVHNTMQSGDRILGSGTAEEFLVDYELLADAILNKLTTKEYAGLGTAAKNIPAAIKELAQGNIPVTFTKAATRSEILSTEKLPTLFGKISKWLSDLGAAAFCKVANNDTTTAAGYVADARAVEKLGKEVDTLNSASAYSNSYEPNGLTAVVRIRNNGFGIRITGTAAQNLGTGTNYATVATIPELSKVLNRDIITREVLATGIFGQLRINQTGAIQIGYTTGNDGNAVSILSGTVFWLEKSFFVI